MLVNEQIFGAFDTPPGEAKLRAVEPTQESARAVAHMFLRRTFAVGFGALAACMLVLPISGAAEPTTILTCTNPVSGFSWRIRINFEQSTVDSNPARITSTEISWHDGTDGGNYTLDRKSGSLTVIFASSTGGYFLHHRCSPQN